MRARLAIWAVPMVVAAVVATPLLRPYLVWGHSTGSDLARIEGFLAAVRGGDVTPGWLPDFYLHHGSPLPSFYAPLVYYVAAGLRLLGGGVLWAPKLTMLLGWVLALAGLGVLTRQVVGPGGTPAAVSALVASPYLLVDVYVRAGLAEVWAFGALAFALAMTWNAARSPSPAAATATAATVAVLVCCHNVTALLASPLLLLFAAGAAQSLRGFLRAVGGVALGFALAAWFWLPALVERSELWASESLTQGHFDYRRHFHDLGGLLRRGPGFTFTAGPEQLPFAFGILPWGGLLAALVLLAFPASRRALGAGRRAVCLLVATGIACLFMVLPASAPLWRLPLLPFVQFPWRFLLPATIVGCALVAAPVGLLPARWRIAATVAVGVVSIAVSRPYLEARYAFSSEGGREPVLLTAAELPPPAALRSHERLFGGPEFWDLGITGTVGHEFLPRTVEALPARAPRSAAEGTVGVTVLTTGWGYPSVWAELDAAGPGVLHLAQFYFPGWEAFLDGEPIPVGPAERSGRLEVEVPVGRHRVEARFGASPIRRLGRSVTLLAGVVLLGVWVRERWTERSAVA